MKAAWYERITILVAGLTIVSYFSCTPEGCGDRGTNYKYDLVTNVTISPAQKAYRVGDTITMSAVLPRVVFNRAKDEMVMIASQDLAHLSWVTLMDSTFDGSQDATQYIQVILDPQRYPSLEIGANAGTRVVGRWEELPNGDFGVGYRFVLRQPGVFRYSFNRFEDLEPRAGTFELQDPCPNGWYLIYNEVNSGSNNNFNLLCTTNKLFCAPAWSTPRSKEENFDRLAGYVFKVIE